MKRMCALVLLATAGCAANPTAIAQSADDSRLDFVTIPPGFHAAAPFTAGLEPTELTPQAKARLRELNRAQQDSYTILSQRLGLRVNSSVDGMPFGTHPFGPWDAGTGPQTP